MLRIYKEWLGRGPTKARTDYTGPDTLISTIENSPMPAEGNMIALEEHQRVREIRMFFQHTAEEDFVDAVEQITGRKVQALVSGIDTTRDLSSEVFYFEPIPAA